MISRAISSVVLVFGVGVAGAGVGTDVVVGFALISASSSSRSLLRSACSFGSNVVGTAIWNFNAGSATDTMTFTGTEGVLETPIFSDSDVIVTRGQERQVHSVRYPPHVHQPLIQAIVDELTGAGRCPSTADSGARASWVLDRCLGGGTH